MTRETKIGLLVGLAFIIVIGILLSDFNRVETQPAQLNAVASNLRGSTDTPRNGSTTDTVIPPPAPPTPRNPVPTPDDLRGGSTRVEIGGPRNSLRPPAGPVRSIHGEDQYAQEANQGDQTDPNRNDAGAVGNDLASYANRNGSPIEIVGPDGRPLTHQGPGTQTPPANPPGPAAAPRSYVAREGDTLNKLAGRFLGGNNKANRDAIISANPSLRQNPNNIIVGRTYAIPAIKGAAPVAAAPAPAPAVATHVAAAKPAAPATSQQQYWYTVKENDNLWRIAADQLGDGNAWTTIKELNRDLLKSGDALHPKMRLRLPAKPVVSAN